MASPPVGFPGAFASAAEPTPPTWAGVDATTASPRYSPRTCAARAETAEIAFGDTDIPILYDWRLRECDFGTRNGSPAAEVKKDRLDYCDRPYPGGESHDQAIVRVARFLADLPTRWAGRRVMLIGHLATYRALEHVTTGLTVRELVAANFEWQPEGWEYRLA